MADAPPLLIGLTGGIGTGKSTVARLLAAHGAAVVDADQAARAVVEPGTPGLAAIVAAFGAEVLVGGALDRAAMRRRIAADPEARRTLEGITHPAIRAWVAEQVIRHVARGARVVVVEAALLVETGGYKAYPVLVVVSCAPETQVRRVMARDGVDEAAARALVATQLPMADKEAVATHVIRNDGDEAALAEAVSALWRAWNVSGPRAPTGP